MLPMLGASATSATPTCRAAWCHTQPPAKYDIPYTGKLTLWVSTQQMIDDTCKTKDGKRTSHTACAMPMPHECSIWILREVVDGKRFNSIDMYDHTMRHVKINLAATLRHELAHCNGWPGDHPDGRSIDIEASVPWPELPESTKWIDAGPKVVCLTPAREVIDCKFRQPGYENWWLSTLEQKSEKPADSKPDCNRFAGWHFCDRVKN
jgi:hypothetical protein